MKHIETLKQRKPWLFCEPDVLNRRVIGYRIYNRSHTYPITRHHHTEHEAWEAAYFHLRKQKKMRIIISAVLLIVLFGVVFLVGGCFHGTLRAAAKVVLGAGYSCPKWEK